MVAVNTDKQELLDHNRLLELFTYEPETGKFLRNSTKGGQKKGSIAGSIDPSTGYIKISVDNKSYRAHRLAWFYVYKRWPNDQVDHIDRNRANNAIENLREVDNRENQNNSSNSTEHPNIYQIGNKYMVMFKINTVNKYFGIYSFEQAKKVRNIVRECIINNIDLPTLQELKKNNG